MSDREIMQQALEALEAAEVTGNCSYGATELLRTRLAQPEQEHAEDLAKLGWQYFECPACGSEGARAFPKPEQEPVAWGCNRYIEDDNGFQIGTDEPELAWGKYAPDDNGWWPLYTTPPQRKPLTDEEIDKIYETKVWDARRSFARAIEAKLKEKNGG